MQLNVNTALETTPNASLAFPKIVGCFSVDAERNYQPSYTNLKYLTCPDEGVVNFDLNRGFKRFINKLPTTAHEEKINHLLEFIARNFHKLRQESKKILRYDFVCFRGLLTKIMITPFVQENWTIRATCLKGTIYMWAWEEENDYPNKEKFIHWGYKFENYMFAKAPNIKPNLDETANANEEFCVMFSTRINNTLILYGAEVDGVNSNTLVDESNSLLNGVKLVEVKTNRIINNQRGERTFLLKTLKWFCQSYLVGIDDIYVGFRNDSGFVKEVVKFPVNELPNKATGLWSKKDCLKFLDLFLNFVQKIIDNQSDPFVTWLFNYDCRSNIVNVSKMENNPEFMFLPQWYIDLINK